MNVLAAITSTLLAAAPAQAPGPCDQRHPTAIGQVACELARALPRESGPTLVVPKPVRATIRAERLDVLAERLTSLVAGELGEHARPSGPLGPIDLAQRTRGRRVIVIGAELDANGLSATADVIAAVPRFWERLRGVAPGSKAHAFAKRPLDAELRSFLPPVPLVISAVDKSGPLDEPSVALACGDADADGSPEIVSVGRHRIQLGRIDHGRYVPSRVVPWSALAEVAPVPLREPIGSAVIRSPGVLDVGVSDRAAAVRLDAMLRPIARYPGRIPWPQSGCAAVNVIALAPERGACETAPRRAADVNEGVDAIAGAQIVTRDGSRRELYARRRQRDGKLELQIDTRWTPLPDAVGAQIALADLDGDGRAELVTTNDTRDPKLDFVRVQTVEDDGTLKEAFRLPVPSGVHALGVCPGDAGSIAPIVLATGEGLWVVR